VTMAIIITLCYRRVSRDLAKSNHAPPSNDSKVASLPVEALPDQDMCLRTGA
jgi:hypothetical protein